MKKLYMIIGLLLISSVAYGATIQRGLIGRQDFKMWTGDTSKTFTRTTSSGGSQTLTRLGSVVDVLATHGDGTQYTYAVLKSAIDESTTTRGLLLNPGTWTITTNLTIPSYITLICPPGCTLSVSNGITLTIQGYVDAGEYQIFSGAGTVTITSDFIEHDMWRDGAGDDVFPTVDNAVDLGSSTNEWKNAFFDGYVKSDGFYVETAEKIYFDSDADSYVYADADDVINWAVANTIQIKLQDGVFLPETDSDVDLGSSSNYFKTAYIDDIEVGDDLRVADHISAGPTAYPHRASFEHSSDTAILINPGAYQHAGTTNQTVYWNSQITFTFGSGGSNASSDDIDAGAWDVHYIYLDDSAIITQASPLLDADCFLNSKTAPTYSVTKHGWYHGTNTNDRCIFAVPTDSADDILVFYHDGGRYVEYDVCVEDLAAANIGEVGAANNVTLSIPAFGASARAKVTIEYLRVNGAATVLWRQNGSSSAGNAVAYVANTATMSQTNTFNVSVDASQIVEFFDDATVTNTLEVITQGFYLPRGM